MAYTYAGSYGPAQIINKAGIPLEDLEVSIFLHGTQTLADLYTDRTKATRAANPTATDALGNLSFFADPGEYDIYGNGQVLSGIILPVDPAEVLSGDAEGTFGESLLLQDTSNVTAILQDILSGGVSGASLGTSTATTQTAGDNSTKLATTAFVATALQAAASGLQPKSPAVVVATTNQTLSGLPTIDGVTLTSGQRVLLTAQTTSSQNGLWDVASGSWTRTSDFASGSTQEQAYVFITSGTVGAGQSWVLSTTSSITVDTSAQTWILFSQQNSNNSIAIVTAAEFGGAISNNWTTAVENAITFLGGAGVVYFPPGTYQLDMSQTGTPITATGITFQGAGDAATFLQGVSSESGSQMAVIDAEGSNFTISNMKVNGAGGCFFAVVANAANFTLSATAFLQGGTLYTLYGTSNAVTANLISSNINQSNTTFTAGSFTSLGTTDGFAQVTVNGTTDNFVAPTGTAPIYTNPGSIGLRIVGPGIPSGSYITAVGNSSANMQATGTTIAGIVSSGITLTNMGAQWASTGGKFTVPTSAGTAEFSYTGISGHTLTGCTQVTSLSGTATVTEGVSVTCLTCATITQNCTATATGQSASLYNNGCFWWNGSDVNAFNLRPGGGEKRISAAGLWTNCHFTSSLTTAAASGLSNVVFESACNLTNCEFDSTPGNGGGALMIHIEGCGEVTIVNPAIWQHHAHNDVVYQENDNAQGIIIQGGNTNAGSGGEWSALMDLTNGGNPGAAFLDHYIFSGSLTLTGGQPTVYASGSNTNSGRVRLNYAGEYPVPQAITLSPTPGVSGALGVAVAASLPTVSNDWAIVASSWTPDGVSTESIGVKYTVTFADGTTESTSPSTVTGNQGVQNLSANALFNLYGTKRIVGIEVQASSSAATTSATPAVNLALIPVA